MHNPTQNLNHLLLQESLETERQYNEEKSKFKSLQIELVESHNQILLILNKISRHQGKEYYEEGEINYYNDTYGKKLIKPSFPVYCNFLQQGILNNVRKVNQQMEKSIESMKKIMPILSQYLKEYNNEESRLSNYFLHQELARTKDLHQISRLKPLTQPIERFNKTKHQGIPLVDDYSLAAIAIQVNAIGEFVYIKNQLNYPLLIDGVIQEKQALEILITNNSILKILNDISRNLTQKEICFFIDRVITVKQISEEQLSALVFILKSHEIKNPELSQKLTQYVLGLSTFNEKLFMAIFGNNGVLFSAEARKFYFDNHFNPSIEKDINHLYSLYIYNNEFRLNDALEDLSGHPFIFDSFLNKAIDEQKLPNQLDVQFLRKLLKESPETIKKMAKKQGNIIINWFSSYDCTKLERIELVQLVPNLFDIESIEKAYSNHKAENIDNIWEDYHYFFNSDHFVNAKRKDLIALGIFKTRIEILAYQQPENIIFLANALEQEWTKKNFPPKTIEIMLKLTKNCLLSLVKDNPTLCQNIEIEQFMAKHRIKRSIFGLIPIPSTLWWTPSTIMFYQFKRQKAQEIDIANNRLKNEINTTECLFKRLS